MVNDEARASFGPTVKSGGVYLYRATAECSACGKVVDVGPFDLGVRDAVQNEVKGWLGIGAAPQWVLSDGFGTRATLCDECVSLRPLRAVLDLIAERGAHGL